MRTQLADVGAREAKAVASAETLHSELKHKHSVAEDYLRQLTELRRQLAGRETGVQHLEEENSNLRATCARISVMEGKVVALERLLQDRDNEIDRMSLLARQQQDQMTQIGAELVQAQRAAQAVQEVRRKAAALQDGTRQLGRRRGEAQAATRRKGARRQCGANAAEGRLG